MGKLLRALLAIAILVLAVVAVVAAYRHFNRVETPTPSANFDPSAFVRSRSGLDAPQGATDLEVVDAMLAMAAVKPDDYVIDLGSGDGRILIAAARSHGAHGLGVEIDPALIRDAEANAQAARVTNLVEFRRQDLFETPLADADVVTLYLTPEVNRRLRPRLLSQMRPGTRVVSHDYDMGEWRPDERRQVGNSKLFLWYVPAQVGGEWQLTTRGGTSTLNFDQSYQQLQGTVTAGDRTSRVEQGRLVGDRITFIADPGDGRREFEGRVSGNRIEPLRPNAGWQAVRPG